MSETDSCRESPDISKISKYHLTGSLLNLTIPHRISSCGNCMIPVVNVSANLHLQQFLLYVLMKESYITGGKQASKIKGYIGLFPFIKRQSNNIHMHINHYHEIEIIR